jgi:excisionase family DNA binding protein
LTQQEPLLTTVEVARRINMTTQAVRKYIKRGRLSAVRIGGEYRIPESEVDALIAGERNVDDAAGGGASPLNTRPIKLRTPETVDTWQEPPSLVRPQEAT